MADELKNADGLSAAELTQKGDEYYNGADGTAQDYAKAAGYYRLAADQGDAAGQCGLGTCYLKGQGVGQNDKEAAKYFTLAADQGYAPAQTKTGVMLQTGEGSDKNEEEAFIWYEKAAEQS